MRRAAISLAALLCWLPAKGRAWTIPPRPVVEQAPSPQLDLVMAEAGPKLDELTEDERLEVGQAIVRECARTGFDPLFVLAVIQVESRFDVDAGSHAGAQGLMQLLPRTFRLVKRVGSILDPVDNVQAGIRYLRRLVDSGFKRPESILLAYNAGPGRAADVLVRGGEMPEDSVSYVPRVMGEYRRLLKKHGRKPEDARQLFLMPVTVVE